MKYNLFFILILIVWGTNGCVTTGNAHADLNDEYKVTKITNHKLFFEIDVEDEEGNYKILSKRSPTVGTEFIKIGHYYKFDKVRLPCYSIRPDFIVLKGDTIKVMANLGVYNDIIYTNYCGEVVSSSSYRFIYESSNLNGLYLK